MKSAECVERDSRWVPLSVIEPLCRPFSRQADPLLDLYDLSRSRSAHPGRCLRCFYDLLGAAEPAKRPALRPLREWIESNLEITCRSETGETGLTFPVELDEPDLETFCDRMMRRAHRDGPSEAERLRMEVRFKRHAA